MFASPPGLDQDFMIYKDSQQYPNGVSDVFNPSNSYREHKPVRQHFENGVFGEAAYGAAKRRRYNHEARQRSKGW